MAGPQMVHEMHADDIGAAAGRVPPPREVEGRNAAIVFLESLLPWIHYGDDRDEHDQNIN